jgi:hypothetical protein
MKKIVKQFAARYGAAFGSFAPSDNDECPQPNAPLKCEYERLWVLGRAIAYWWRKEHSGQQDLPFPEGATVPLPEAKPKTGAK